jgi:adenine-specific DNA methylase
VTDLFAAAEARRAAEVAEAQACFIERQLPVSKLSKESYKERKSNAGQTLTALGSYWKGRKPLILVRAVILGLLLPATDDPAMDRAIFLKLMLMDDEGLRKRKAKSIPVARARQLLPAQLHGKAFDGARWSRRLSRERRAELEILAFDAMGLDEKLTYCVRPEELPDSALDDVWPAANAHLGTTVTSLPELVRQLGERRFGHAPRVGDPFCGGGSIPFEAARLGCDVYASDLNPIACLLTWGALNIVGGSDETRTRIAEAQARIVAAVDRQIVDLGFEHDGFYEKELRLPIDAPTRFPHGWKVNRQGEPVPPETPPYTVTCPQTGWRVPLVSTFRVHEPTKTILDLVPDPDTQSCRLVPRQGVSDDEWKWAEDGSVAYDPDLRDWFLSYEGPLLHNDSPPEDCLYHVRIPSRAKAYLYCLETRCPKTGWLVPMAPSWVISKNYRTVARLVPDADEKRFRIEVATGVSDEAIAAAEAAGTVKDRALRYHLDGREYVTPITALRGDVELRSRYPDAESRRRDEERLAACRNRYSATAGNDLRRWEKSDIVPREGDIFQERLYCIQWSRPDGSFFYASVTERDEKRERQVTAYVQERLADWQAKGLVPDLPIEPGAKTDEPIRTRGWTHWQHLFNPRHLLIGALIRREMLKLTDPILAMGAAIGLCRSLNHLSKLTQWLTALTTETSGGNEDVKHVFYNQAFNTFYNYGARPFSTVADYVIVKPKHTRNFTRFDCLNEHAANISEAADTWISDPPYADAIIYHEITEYFISWLCAAPPRQDWIWDSRRELAIKGEEKAFRQAMVAAYAAMAKHMPANGLQVVMFTHQDVGVWADLAEILWAAGLQVTAGWCIATETDKPTSTQGNYVQGTVLLVLRKRLGEERGYLARLQRPVEDAVREQLAAMQALDDREQPNFADADYQLAAYAAALKVLTRYAVIDGKPVASEVLRERRRGEGSEVERLLDRARRLASDFLVPERLPRPVWDELGPEERFFLKGLELERAGEVRIGAYQEMARGFGVEDYRAMLATTRANQVRLKTAAEFGRRDLKRAGSADRAEDAALDRFAAGVVRHALYGIREAAESGDLRDALIWFRGSLPDYWDRQRLLIGVLDYVAAIRTDERAAEAEVAQQLAGAVRNDRP